MNILVNPLKMRRIVVGYWLTIPLIFGLYISILAAVKNTSVLIIFINIPSLTLASIVVFLLFFQLFGLFIVGNTSDCRRSLLGFYLKFNMAQQLFSLNIPGFILCLIYYRSLLDAKEKVGISKQVQWTVYALMVFIGFITSLLVWIRLSL